VRHRVGLAAAVSIAVALVAGTTIAVLQARESARQRDHALAELRLAEAKNDFSDQLLSLATPNAKPISNAELLARGEALIPRRFAHDVPLRVNMLLTLADRYSDNLQFDASNRMLAQAYADSRSITDVSLKSLATCRWASQFAERGDFSRAYSLLDSVLPILSATRDYAETEARCRVFEAEFASQNRNPARAIPAAERAVFLEEHRGGAPGRLFNALAALAEAYGVGLRWDAADRTFARALATLESDGLGNTRTAAIVLNNWAVMLQNAGQTADATKLSGRAVDVARAADSENGANLGLLSNYGSQLAAIGNYADGDRILEESLAKARVAGSPSRLVVVLQSAIKASCDAGDASRAARLLSEAYAVLNTDSTPNEYSKAVIQISAARVALATGDKTRATDLAAHAVQMFATATSTRAGMLQAEIFHARSLNASGRFSEALAVADRGVHDAAGRLGDLKHSSFMGQALLELATAKSGLGDTSAARSALVGALENLHASIGMKGPDVQRAETLRQVLDAR
jgi:tetratricopeptide (TPR) repeat protein